MKTIFKVLAITIGLVFLVLLAGMLAVKTENMTNPYVRLSINWPWTKEPATIDVNELNEMISNACPGDTIIVYPDGTMARVVEFSGGMPTECTLYYGPDGMVFRKPDQKGDEVTK